MKHLMLCLILLLPSGIRAENVIITLKNGETHTGAFVSCTDTVLVMSRDSSGNAGIFRLDGIAEVVLGEVTLQGVVSRQRIADARARGDEKPRRDGVSAPSVRAPEKSSERKNGTLKSEEMPWQPIDSLVSTTKPAVADTAAASPAFSRDQLAQLAVCPHCGSVNYRTDDLCGKCGKKIAERPSDRIPKGRNSQPDNHTAQKYTGTMQIIGGSLGVLFTVLDATRPWTLFLRQYGTDTVNTRYEARSGWSNMHSATVGLSIGVVVSGAMTLHFAAKP